MLHVGLFAEINGIGIAKSFEVLLIGGRLCGRALAGRRSTGLL
jgi:hypothetical protein